MKHPQLANVGRSGKADNETFWCQIISQITRESELYYTIYKFISEKLNLISDSCNWISDPCNWISDFCNWISVLCNIISDKWNLISTNEIEFRNHYLPIFFQRQNWMCLFWTYFRTLLVVSAIYTRKLIYFFANEIKLSFAKITGFN